MSYATIEVALLAVLQGTTSFSSSNCVRGHFRPMASKSESVTLTPGAVTGRDSHGIRTVTTDWNINIQLFVRANRANVEDTYADIESLRQELIDEVDANPTLNGTANVVLARIIDASEPDWLQRGRSNIWTQQMRCLVRERVLITGGEYA